MLYLTFALIRFSRSATWHFIDSIRSSCFSIVSFRTNNVIIYFIITMLTVKIKFCSAVTDLIIPYHKKLSAVLLLTNWFSCYLHYYPAADYSIHLEELIHSLNDHSIRNDLFKLLNEFRKSKI